MALQTHRMIENRGNFINEEYVVSTTGMKPGMLLMLNSSGELAVHNVGETRTSLMLGDLDPLQGSITSTAYLDDASVPVVFPSKGSVVNVLVQSGDVVTIGKKLASAGDGYWMVVETATSGTENDGVMLEAIEGQTAALSAATLVACRVM